MVPVAQTNLTEPEHDLTRPKHNLTEPEHDLTRPKHNLAGSKRSMIEYWS